jgi:UDP-2,3-diacylglucosamine hydrolase
MHLVFISDLHLHAEDKNVQARFERFIAWLPQSVTALYILGDFFSAWPGDDSMDEWSKAIAAQMHALTQRGLRIYYLHGNRDFLLGRTFARQAGWTILPDPCVIRLGDEPVLLTHGDQYCTKDIGHQRFRRLTRNRAFIAFFLSLPLRWRQKLIDKLRMQGRGNTSKSLEQMDVVDDAIIRDLQANKTEILIHGHTHKPGLTQYGDNEPWLKRYVLSDWDDTPKILCYNRAKGLHFIHTDFIEE